MMERRIERWYDGNLRPTFPDPPELSSARAPWSGFLMERDPCLSGADSHIVWPYVELIMVTSGGVWVEERAYGASKRFLAEPGSITIWPAAHESRSLCWSQLEAPGDATEILSVQLDPAALRLLTPEIESGQFAMQPAVHDPVMSSLMRLIEADVQTGCAAGRLYGESLSLALASHVMGRYAVVRREQGSSRAGLSVQQRERMREFVRTNLDGDLRLAELAREAGLSPQHFTLRFRNTFGTTPHQYILRERVEQAKRLLARPTLSIVEVAFSVGFASHSHFASAFRRAVGVTPRDYRSAL